VIDDFAHHPTAVRETVEAIRAAYAGRKVWAVFEPRSNTSKRNIFEREFAAALALADRILIAGMHQPEKVLDGERLSVESVVRRINRLCGDERARQVAGAGEIASVIADDARPGDVILVMSNGGFDNVHDKILRALAA
jgi:UDP-N-acetylmuramate: L-alanyl-gamma-D-glutamyl-meso-diaminopimelate ligase